MDKSPKISVIMPVYNAGKYLSEAIQSILTQTFSDFELIVSYDDSTDNSLEIIEKYKNIDDRIVLSIGHSRGLVKSLNDAINISKGEYIARMDADDISLPRRFEEQINYISKEKLDICGTFIELFDKKNSFGVIKYPEKDQDIKFMLMFMTSFAHPSVIIKRTVFNNLKYKDYKYAEDYKLWIDIALKQYRMGNIGNILLRYRVHCDQISKNNSVDLMHQANSIACQFRRKSACSQINLFNENLDLYYKNSTSINLNILIKKLKSIANKGGISPKFVLIVIRHIFKNSSKVNILLFITYYFKTINMGGRNWQDASIFIASLFGIHKKSFIYKQVKNSKFL